MQTPYSSIFSQHSISRLMLLIIALCATLPLWMQDQHVSAEGNEPQDHRIGLAGSSAQSPTAGLALLYSSYVGGDGADSGKDVAVDAAGNIYVIGKTFSDTLMGIEIERKGYSDVFVAKFNPTATQLLYLTLMGGNDSESPMSLEVDAQGNVYGMVTVFDETFPTKNAQWPTPTSETTSALFKLDSNGEVVYSTYLPQHTADSRQALTVDAAGNAYTVGTYWGIEEGDTYLGAQIALIKLDPTGSQLLLDRHFGGTGTELGIAIDVDAQGNIYVTGTTSSGNGFPTTANAHQQECGDLVYDPDAYCYQDSVVVVLNASGDLTYASYHGGNQSDSPQAIAADGKGNFIIAGDTFSGKFPLVNALQDSCPLGDDDRCYMIRGFVSMIHMDSGQGTITYSTYLGSTERNSNNAVLDATMDSTGNAYISGYTNGKQFPLANAIQNELYESFCSTFGSERYCFDGFITKISPTGELLMGSYLGAISDDYAYGITVDGEDNIYVAGLTEASNFPTTDGAYQPNNLVGDDAFLVKIGTAESQPPTATPTLSPTPSPTPQPTGTSQTTETPQPTGTVQTSETPEPTETPQTTVTPQGPPPPPPPDAHKLMLPKLMR